VDFGNVALKRIPYEEWGLKSIHPLSARKKEEALASKKEVQVSFPSALIPEQKVLDLLRTLGTERQALHKKRMIYSFIGMPISAPFALIPIVPNLPFFYLVYRAWSHWRALSGGTTIKFLLDNNLIRPTPSRILEDIYSAQIVQPTSEHVLINKSPEKALKTPDLQETEAEESMVLSKSSSKAIAEALDIPELEVELDRAIWQVETKLEEEEALKQEQRALEKAAPESRPVQTRETP